MKYGRSVVPVNGLMGGRAATLSPAPATGQNATSMRAPTFSLALCLIVSMAALSAACHKDSPPPAHVEAAPGGLAALSAAAAGLEPAGDPPAQPEANRPASKESCAACRGEWGPHGLAQVDSCICRTKDGGRVCHDGLECEGQCLADEDGFEATEKGPPARGFAKGRCAEFVATFGCHSIVPRGARAKGPKVEAEAIEKICID